MDRPARRFAARPAVRLVAARSTRRNPVAEFIMTIGPLARATAMMRGSLPNPNRRISSGTKANIGVVTNSRMYGVTIFSTNGNCVMTAASMKPIEAPIMNPTASS